LSRLAESWTVGMAPNKEPTPSTALPVTDESRQSAACTPALGIPSRPPATRTLALTEPSTEAPIRGCRRNADAPESMRSPVFPAERNASNPRQLLGNNTSCRLSLFLPRDEPPSCAVYRMAVPLWRPSSTPSVPRTVHEARIAGPPTSPATGEPGRLRRNGLATYESPLLSLSRRCTLPRSVARKNPATAAVWA